MKNLIVNTLFTTGAALVILAGFFIIFDADVNFAFAVFEIFGANIVINCGIFLMIKKIEIRNLFLEYLLHISFIIVVLVIFGIIFDWYASTPVWVLVIMAIVIYLFAVITSIAIIKKDTKEINELLEKRNKKL